MVREVVSALPSGRLGCLPLTRRVKRGQSNVPPLRVPLQGHQLVYQSLHRIYGCRHGLPGLRASGKGDYVVGGGAKSLSYLVEKLEEAIEEEEYGVAAELRDEIERRRQDNRLAVEEANEKFYQAFRTGNLLLMSQIWGTGAHIQCIHPAAECIANREQVMNSWKIILGSGQKMQIDLEDVRIYATDTEAFVTLIEVVNTDDSKGRVAATNIFEKQKGSWKLVHHHGSPVPRRI